MPYVADQTYFFEHTNDDIADVRLLPGPSQAGRGRACVMIAMPVLALKKLHETQPAHVTAGVLADRRTRLTMTDAVYKALGMKREDQPDCAEPEEGGQAEIQSAKK